MKIGITERGDAELDFSWINKVDSVDGLICISKASNNDLIENLIKHKDKIIQLLKIMNNHENSFKIN